MSRTRTPPKSSTRPKPAKAAAGEASPSPAAPLRGHASLDAGSFGTLWLTWSDVGVVRVDFDSPPVWDHEREVPTRRLPKDYGGPLRAYFAGKDVDPADLPVDLRGTDFQMRVWAALRRVPRGRVRSYAGIAADVGSPRAMRAVGMANARNPVPILVPCHRIVQAGLRLGGYTGGVHRKRHLLTLEKVELQGEKLLPGQLELF